MMPGGPGGNPQFPGMQQGGFPMMGPGNPQMMMPPGQMMRGQMMPGMQQQMMAQAQMQQAYMTNPFLNPGGFMPMQGPGGFVTPNPGGQYVNQVPYNQQMPQGKEQRMLEEQKRRAEQEAKQRRMQEQQKRLKEFNAIGGRKMDADSLIESIIGPKPGSMRPQPTGPPGAGPPNVAPPSYSAVMQHKAASPGTNAIPPQPAMMAPTVGNISQSAAPVPQAEDDFSDFMSGPSAQQAPPQPVKTPNTEPAPITKPPQTVTKREDKKDLMSMMMECSDLSKPKEAKGFRKPTVNEVQVAPKQAATFQVSQKSRQWAADSGELSDLFQVPAEQRAAAQEKSNVGAQDPSYPKWLTGKKPMPDVYLQVLEASMREGKIDTDVVYPILMRSNLPREVLGHVWSICNKHSPGQLIKEELFLILAMISVAQNNLNWQTTEILNRCPHAPIPNLGQAGPPPSSQAPPPQGEQGSGPSQGNTSVSQTPPTYSQAPHQHPTPVVGTVMPLGPPPNNAQTAENDDDDFADFQTAPTAPAPSPGGAGLMPPPLSVPTPNVSLGNLGNSLMGDEDKYSVFKQMGKALETNMDTIEDDFDDFKSVDSSTTTSSGLGDIMPSSMMPNVSPAHTTAGIPSSSLANFSSLSLQPDTAKSTISNSSSSEFADFQGPPSAPVSSAPPADDKYSALKAMIMDNALYTKPAADENKDTGAEPEQDDWAGFQDATGSKDGVSKGGGAGLFQATGDGSISFPPAPPAADSGSDGWAAFSSAPPPQSSDIGWTASTATVAGGATKLDDDFDAFSSGSKPDYSNDIISDDDFFKQVSGPKSGVDSKPIPTTAPISAASSNVGGIKSSIAKPGVDKKKAFGMFARNLDITVPSAGTGMSPLDITPPDMPPDLPADDTADVVFDKFGIPSGGLVDEAPGEGISSLAAPYGDLDDFGDFSASKPHVTSNPNRQYNLGPLKTKDTKDTSDSQSISSLEFTGWSGKEKAGTPSREDAKSTHSLELRSQPNANGSQDSSPAGGDSQSVSSLEFPGGTDPGRKSGTPQDSRSISSLELKPPELATETSGSVTPEGGDDFGDFNSATSQTNNGPTLDYSQKPRDASELITQGNMLSATLSDRYSGLSAEPQDSDRHIYDWTRCLNKCCEMIREANNALNSVSSSIVCNEVIASEQGQDYLQGVVEMYRVACRIKQSMKSASVSNARLHSALQDLEMAWDCLKTFISSTRLMPSPEMLDFTASILKAEQENAQQRACGICLMDVNPPSNGQAEDTKLAYAGREYHSTCANFWVNCVDSTLPSLKIIELL